MGNQIQTFTNDGQILFCGKDVDTALDLVEREIQGRCPTKKMKVNEGEVPQYIVSGIRCNTSSPLGMATCLQ